MSEKPLIIRGPGGIQQEVTRQELDLEADRLLRQRQKKQRPVKPSRYRVVPSSGNVDSNSISRLIKRIKGNG